MSFKLGDIVKPTGGLRLTAQMGTPFSPKGKNLTASQEQVMNDWDHLKFQRSDLPEVRGVMNKAVDNVVTLGAPIAEKSGQQFWERYMPNTFGKSAGTAQENAAAQAANQSAVATQNAATVPNTALNTTTPTQAEIELLKSQGYLT